MIVHYREFKSGNSFPIDELFRDLNSLYISICFIATYNLKQRTHNQRNRQTNLQKHGLDFADAGVVLESRYRMDVETQRGDASRIISFHRASNVERNKYYDWLDNQT